MLSILSFNVALQDVRILGRTVYRPLAYTEERLTALSNALRRNQVDIVCLQECFHRRHQDAVWNSLSDAYPYALGFARRGPKLRLGNELLTLSRHPLTDKGLLRFRKAMVEEKLFTRLGIHISSVNIPSAGEFRILNLHMSAGGALIHPESRYAERVRSDQIEQLATFAASPDPVIVAGDLNCGPEASKLNYERLLMAGFVDSFSLTGGSGVTWDPANPLVIEGGEAHLPPQRIDHILLNPAALERLTPKTGRVVMQTPSVTLNEGRRIPISDHYGVMVEFELASQ
jgi:endonuclease/exonuclease/phosphatase family metal-dependent hydrolase